MSYLYLAIVTIKLPKNPKHDPHNKVTAACPFSGTCTDSTGEHHSGLVRNLAELQALREQHHITRVEYI
jgi:hypothetical protein